MRTPDFHPRAGATLLEVLIASSLLAVVLGGAALVSTEGQSSFDSTALSSNMDARANEVIERLRRELSGVSPTGVMFPDPDVTGSNQMTFQVAQGYSGGAVTWSALTSLAYQMEPGELDDGLDNDGDGLIDEGLVMVTRDVGGPGQVTGVVCNGVAELLDGEVLNADDDNGNGMDDESGFCLQRLGDLLIVRLTLLDANDEGELIGRTVETSIRMRN